jgi:hypothetical protein
MELKRTFKRDKKSGRMVETTPERVKAMLPKQRRKPKSGVPALASWNRPVRMLSVSVHSSQVADYREDAKQAGFTGIEVRDDGTIFAATRSQRKEYFKHRTRALQQMTGDMNRVVHDRDGGYGD